MLFYDNRRWLQVVFAYKGTVWRSICGPFIMWLVWVALSYANADASQLDLNLIGHWDHLLGVSMSCLLIFRANQAYLRYLEGQDIVTAFFSDLRQFVMLTMLYVQASTSEVLTTLEKKTKVDSIQIDGRARDLRVDAVRLAVAFAITLRMHTKVALSGYHFGSINGDAKWQLDWDRFRLRQLLRDHEFAWADRALGVAPCDWHAVAPQQEEFEDQFSGTDVFGQKPIDWPGSFSFDAEPAVRPNSVVVFLIRELLFRNINDSSNSAPWGIKERLIPGLFDLLGSMQLAFESMDKIITTPLPFPYASLCKTLLVLCMLSFPLTIDQSLGIFGGVAAPLVVALALLSLDALANELENPFGDDHNDLDLVSRIHELECEAMEFLTLADDAQGRDRFVWRRLPADFLPVAVAQRIGRQLAFRECAAAEVAPSISVRSGSASGSAEQSQMSVESGSDS